MAWLKLEGAEATMRYIISTDLIDTDQPEQSKLLLKPLNIIEHGGGVKMAIGDTDYIAFLNWIRDYSNIVNEGYTSAESLPARTKLTGSEIWLRIENVPQRLLDRTGLITVHARDDYNQWNDTAIAITSFNVRRNKRFAVFAQGFLMIASEQNDKPHLLAGEYQVRLYLDPSERKTTNFEAALEDASYVAAAAIKATWQPGWRNATVVPAWALLD